jgi:hypothetical protein
LKEGGWTWKDSPSAGAPEVSGLRIVVMLLSNWDNKDASDRTNNTGILEGGSGERYRRIYYVTNRGGSMGKWGREFFHSKWDCEDFAGQSDRFVTKIDDDGEVKFGFCTGNHSGDFQDDITTTDVKWLLRRLNGITQMEKVFPAGRGASEHDLRDRYRTRRNQPAAPASED